MCPDDGKQFERLPADDGTGTSLGSAPKGTYLPAEFTMPLTKDKSTPENREFWAFVEKTAAEVATWPDWKTGRRTMPNEIDLKGLREKANWFKDGYFNQDIGDNALHGLARDVLALLNEIERLRGERDWYYRPEEQSDRATTAEAEVSALKARLAECEGHYAWAVADGKKLQEKLERVQDWVDEMHCPQLYCGAQVRAILEEQS